jgi:Arc/MetJ-type ribon-helix-helix transcriptional regulator
MELTVRSKRRTVLAMTINITAEDEKLIQEKLRTGEFRSVEEVIHRALVSLATPEATPEPARPRRTLIEVLSEPPFAGSELNLERIKDYPRPLDL